MCKRRSSGRRELCTLSSTQPLVASDKLTTQWKCGIIIIPIQKCQVTLKFNTSSRQVANNIAYCVVHLQNGNAELELLSCMSAVNS